MSLTTNLLRFTISLRLAFVALVACIVAFTLYVTGRNSLQTANELRFASIELADELRQSSDDLTRMVRTYVATGDHSYKDHYEEILAIRDGLKPRPQEYQNVYWDLVLDDRRPTRMGTAESLLHRMVSTGFTQEELNRLGIAKNNSDQLVAVERQAMQLVEAGGDAAANRLAAISMLHDAFYHRAKADIMRPINETTRMVDERTAGLVASTQRHLQLILGILVLSVLLLLLMLWWINRNLRRVLGGSVYQLGDTAMRAADGGGAPTAPLDEGDRESVLGKLIEVQRVRANSERALSETERRFRRVVGALDEGVCVVQDAIIRYVNPKLLGILKLPEEKLLDRPFIQFVHANDRKTLMDSLRNRADGAAADPTGEFDVQTGPGEILRIRTKATEFEWSGRPATLYFIHVHQGKQG